MARKQPHEYGRCGTCGSVNLNLNCGVCRSLFSLYGKELTSRSKVEPTVPIESHLVPDDGC